LDLISSALLGATSDLKAKKALSRRYKELAFSAYPYAPEVTDIALQRSKELGFGEFHPKFPTPKGELFASILGWRLTKRINHLYHQLKNK
jgi:hypothetical protein